MQSHPWSVVDAETGSLVKEVVAEEGLQSIPIGAVDSPIVRADAQDEAQPIAAFDGLGGPRESYTPVQVPRDSTLGFVYFDYGPYRLTEVPRNALFGPNIIGDYIQA